MFCLIVNVLDCLKNIDCFYHNNDWLSYMQCLVLYKFTQPSSSAAEQVLSLLNANFSDQQDLFLLDYVELSLMYQYNNQWDSYIMYPWRNVW